MAHKAQIHKQNKHIKKLKTKTQKLISPSQMEFVSNVIIYLLESIDNKLKAHFIEIKQTLESAPKNALIAILSRISSQDKILPIIKAFTLYHMLLNIIEELNINNATILNTLSQAIDELCKEGYAREDVLDVLQNLHFYPVFTAHPTESRRRTFLEAHHKMSENIGYIFRFYQQIGKNPRFFDDKELASTPHSMELEQLQQAKQDLLYRLHLLWYTHLVRSEKMEVLFELDNLLYITESSILSSATQVLGDVEAMLNHKLESSPITLGSWIGGDRDGNPFVSNEIMTQAMKIAHKSIVEVYIHKVDKLIRELSMSMDFITPSPRLLQSLQEESEAFSPSQLRLFSKEPFRAKLLSVKKKLQNRLIAINATESIEFSYKDSKAFLADIDMLIESLDAISARELVKLRHLVLLAGFHLLQLDFREHREVILNAISEIFCLMGLCDSDFKDLSEKQKVKILNVALSNKRIDLRTFSEQLSMQSARFVGAFVRIQWAKKHISEHILQSFIISMCADSSDLLCVLWFAKQSGLWKPGKQKDNKSGKAKIAIVPLFETINDLQRAKHIIATLHNNPHYQQYLLDADGRQEIMVGYSDSSKDGGIFASNYNLYKAIGNLSKLQSSLNLHIRFFHGRGGSVSRGGGSLEESLLASPPQSVYGILKTTEQGEVISSKYLNPHIATMNFSSTLGALLKKGVYDAYCVGAQCEIDPYTMKLLEPISAISQHTYRKLVYEHKGFMEYFKSATPIAFVQNLNLGSRPSKRKDTQKVEDLRAIPWVFAWTQNRTILPAWYGLGSGLASGDKSALKSCYETSLFFKTTIDNIAQAFLKVDVEIAKLYNDFVTNQKISKDIWEAIYSEYQLTMEHLLHLRGENELLDSQISLQESILLRKPYLSVLNLAQIELIKKYHQCAYPKAQTRILEEIHATIVGIAQGMRNTG